MNDWYGEPAGGWPTKDDVRRMVDPKTGISIRFIRQWRPAPLELAAPRAWLEWARWQRALTDDDRAWLREGGISPL